jgi:hypothetical protein
MLRKEGLIGYFIRKQSNLKVLSFQAHVLKVEAHVPGAGTHVPQVEARVPEL